MLRIPMFCMLFAVSAATLVAGQAAPVSPPAPPSAAALKAAADYSVSHHGQAVLVMYDGRIVRSGDKSLALELEEKGYTWLKKALVHA